MQFVIYIRRQEGWMGDRVGKEKGRKPSWTARGETIFTPLKMSFMSQVCIYTSDFLLTCLTYPPYLLSTMFACAAF